MKRVFSLLLVVVMVAGLFAGCAPKAEDTTTPATTAAATEATTAPAPADVPQILKWNVGADPKTIDPTLNGASDGGDVINQTFEALTREKKWCCLSRYC